MRLAAFILVLSTILRVEGAGFIPGLGGGKSPKLGNLAGILGGGLGGVGRPPPQSTEDHFQQVMVFNGSPAGPGGNGDGSGSEDDDNQSDSGGKGRRHHHHSNSHGLPALLKAILTSIRSPPPPCPFPLRSPADEPGSKPGKAEEGKEKQEPESEPEPEPERGRPRPQTRTQTRTAPRPRMPSPLSARGPRWSHRRQSWPGSMPDQMPPRPKARYGRSPFPY